MPIFQIASHGDIKHTKISNKPFKHSTFDLPLSNLSNSIFNFVSSNVSQQVLYHSLRLYQFGITLLQDHFPDWEIERELLFTTCLLHNISIPSTSDGTIKSSQTYRGFIAYDLIFNITNGNRDYAETVAHAIVNSDAHESGRLSSMSLILQMAETLDSLNTDNILIHQDTYNTINEMYPKAGWKGCSNNFGSISKI